MRILSIQTLSGANVHSYRPIIRVKLDLGQYEDIPSNALGNFNVQLMELLPGLMTHRCSRGILGGFNQRLEEGTYLAHIFEHVALELQCQAGYEIGFGKARGTGRSGIYEVVIGYRSAPAAIQAAYAAERLIMAVINKAAFAVEESIAMIRQVGQTAELGPSTAAINEAAKRRGIPVSRIGEDNLLILGYGRQQQRIWTTITGRTSALASDLACDKHLTKIALAEGGIPVPQGLVVEDAEGAVRALESLGGPVAIKPATGNQGKGVTLGVTTPAEAKLAYHIAARYSSRVVVEEYIAGRQYRICVVNGKMAAAAERIPAHVIGDGKHTVHELVELVNHDPRRGDGHEKPLTKIQIDAIAVTVLARQGLTPRMVPNAGRIVYIRENANLSTGATAVDVTDIINASNAFLAERAAMLIGLDIAGVDIVANDITEPIKDGHGAIIEVNAAPGIRMHHFPSAGKARDVAGRIVDYLFPNNSDGRIPVIAVTGTNGKTTVSRMLGHVWQLAGYTVGMTTTEGIYIGGRRVVEGDTTGPASAHVALFDPAVEVAVLETARGGILRSGLGFESCDVGILTNISEDHFGQDGIEELSDLIYIKSLVVEMVRPGGISLLNADDPYVNVLASRARGEIVYFSTEADNLIIRRHLSIGGKAFFVKDGVIYAAHGNLDRAIVRVSDIPVTLGGIAQHNIQNSVAAAAACYCLKVPISFIRRGLTTFDCNPGRLNLINIGDTRVCVDYGHNPAGYQALIRTVKRLGARRLVGVIGAPGDRRDDVILNIGRIAGRGFDYIYIKEDSDLRGRSPGETAELLRQGVLDAGLSIERVKLVLDEEVAVSVALSAAEPGDLVVIFYEKYEKVMGVLASFAHVFDRSDDVTRMTEHEQVVVAGMKSL